MGALPVDRLRQYLRQLSPGVRALLAAELERALQRGDKIPGGDLVLQEVRGAVRISAAQTPSIGDPARLFFAAVEPFILDEAPVRKHRCRIARTSLEPIWAWICRDLAAVEAKTYAEAVSRALATNDTAGWKLLTAAFQDQAAERIIRAVAATASDEKARRRLVAQVGGTAVFDDARELADILKIRDTLTLWGERLPAHIRNLGDGTLDATKAVLDIPSARAAGVFPYLLTLVMTRLAAPWQLIRLAVRAAQSDDASRIAATPYAIAVTLVLGDIERMVDELNADLKHGGATSTVIHLLKCIHDAVRGVRTELNLPVDQPWSRQLSAIRAEIADLLREAIESAPGRVRRLLRSRPLDEINPGAVLDNGEVAETEALIELVGACRNYAGELAISEMTTRAYGELQQVLDTGTNALLDSLRVTDSADRTFRQSQFDAILRFCGKAFGQEYASLLTKAAEVAAHSDRRAPARA